MLYCSIPICCVHIGELSALVYLQFTATQADKRFCLDLTYSLYGIFSLRTHTGCLVHMHSVWSACTIPAVRITMQWEPSSHQLYFRETGGQGRFVCIRKEALLDCALRHTIQLMMRNGMQYSFNISWHSFAAMTQWSSAYKCQ